MRGVNTRPPRLGFTLLLLTVSSVAMVVLRFISEPTMTLGSFIPAFMAVHSTYDLVRYFQRRGALKRAALAGEDTWPAVPLFPGKARHPQFTTSTGFWLWSLLAFNRGILPTRDRRPGPDGGMSLASLALLAVYLLGLTASVIIYMQARRMRKAEDNEVCAVSHKMRCQKCEVYRAALDKPQPPPSTNLHRKVINMLPMNVALSLVLCGALLALVPARMDVIWVAIATAALTAAHRLFFFFRARLAPPVDWPSARLFPSRVARKTFNIGNKVAYYLSIYAVVYAFVDDRLGWRAGGSARMALIAQIMVLVTNFVIIVFALVMDKDEQRVVCAREGHCWKCVRHCSIAQDTEASPGVPKVVDEKVVDEKVAEELSKEDIPAC